jgi:peptidyl-prolyl cis-trans isomerase SurA
LKRLAFFVFLVVCGGVLPFGPAHSAPIELDRVVAVVNKEVITWAELYRAMEFEYAQRIGMLSDKEKREFLKAGEGKYLERMIDMTLQLQEAERLDLAVEDAEVDEAIEQIKKKYGFDDKKFREALSAEGFSYEDYKKRLSDQILMGKVVSREVREKVVVSDRDVEEFLKEKGARQEEGEGYHLLQIFFPRPEGRGDDGSPEEKAREALGRVRSGEDFSLVAREYSPSDPDLGFIKRDVLAPEFIEVIDAMKPGEVSEPFPTEQGLHMVKLVEKMSPENRDTLLAKARKELQDKRFDEEYASWLKQLRARSFVEIRL